MASLRTWGIRGRVLLFFGGRALWGGGGDGWGERLFSLSQPHLREKKKEFLYPLCTCPQTLAELTYLSKIIRPNHAI